jgi:predicted DsbA family dithiol-disulfide isomerase
LRERYDIIIRWFAFPLHPHTPSEGMTLEELFAGRSINIDKLMERLQQVAQEEGLPLGKREYTYNSRLAQELSKWAEVEGKGQEFHDAVFRAYFVAGKNIGLQDTLVAVARSVGLSGSEAQNVLETRAFKEAVDMDWILAKRMGITAVPTFVVNKQGLVGAQPYEVLEEFLQDNHVPKRPSNA